MYSYELAQEMVKDAHRIADDKRLIAIAKQSPRNQNRQGSTKKARSSGSTQISKWVSSLLYTIHQAVKV